MSTRPPMPSLDPEQRGRADALVQARWIVGKHHDGSVDALDVHALARFILTGEDPFNPVALQAVRCNWPDDGSDAVCVLPMGHDDHVFEEVVEDRDAEVRHLRTVYGDAVQSEADDEGGESP